MDDPYAARGERKPGDTVEMPAVDDDGKEVQGELALWPTETALVELRADDV